MIYEDRIKAIEKFRAVPVIMNEFMWLAMMIDPNAIYSKRERMAYAALDAMTRFLDETPATTVKP